MRRCEPPLPLARSSCTMPTTSLPRRCSLRSMLAALWTPAPFRGASAGLLCMIRRSLVPPAVPANRHRGHEAALASFHCRGAAGIDPLESGGQIPSGTTSLKGRVARTSGPPPKSLDAGKACHGGRAAVGSCGRGRESRKNLATRGGAVLAMDDVRNASMTSVNTPRT